MKRLILLNGTMGVGKTTTSRALQQLLPNSVFLDGDWCWDMNPFIVTEETKAMVLCNIHFLLNSFLHCSVYDNIIFCWVMDEQSIIDSVLSGLDLECCTYQIFSLVANQVSLEKRLNEDVKKGIRTAEILERSIARINKYQHLSTEKVDVSNRTAKEAAQYISDQLTDNR